MLETRLLEFDPVTRTKRLFHFDHNTDQFYIEEVQDVEAIAEANKAQFNQIDERARWRDMNLVASIPMTVLEDLRKHGILDDDKEFRRWLNSSENRVFRTRPGVV